MKCFKRGVFYDFHTDPVCPQIGGALAPEEFASELAECSVDYVTLHARCNQGFCYYDTNIGIRHPGLKNDFFGDMLKSCRKKGLGVSSYLNGGISHEEGIRHPEWLRINPDGRILQDKDSPFVRLMCFNSGYAEHFLAMIREIGAKYHPDGFFIDCFGFSHNCVCSRCVQAMRRNGLDPGNADDRRFYGKKLSVDFAGKIAAAVMEHVPDPLLYFNGLGYEEQKGIGTYIDLECLPASSNWGYDYLPLAARHARALGYPFLANMTARFPEWGEFGGIRSKDGIVSDLLHGLSLGFHPNIGSHLHPQGRWETPVFQCIKDAYSQIRAFEPYFETAHPQAEAAVVFMKTPVYFTAKPEMRGVAALLSELQLQFDVITPETDFTPYRLLILMPGLNADAMIQKRIRAHLSAGKALWQIGDAGMDSEKNFFPGSELGIRTSKGQIPEPAYFLTVPAFSGKLAKMPVSIQGSILKIENIDADVCATVVEPAISRGWDGLHCHYYLPPELETEIPAVTIKERTAFCAFNLFLGYQKSGAQEMKELAGKIIDRLLPDRMLKIDGGPSFLHGMVSADKKYILVALHCFLREDKICCGPVNIRLRGNRMPFIRVFRGSDRSPLSFKTTNGETEITVSEINGFELLVCEMKNS